MSSQFFVRDLEKLTQRNRDFRHVISTTQYQQLVLMSIEPLDEIGTEVHSDVDQFIRVEKGKGLAILNDQVYRLRDGMAVIISAGTRHNIINNSRTQPLKLYTIYSPPEHKPMTILKKKVNHT